MWGLPQKQNARRADKIRLCGHLRRYKKIVKKIYIISVEIFDCDKSLHNSSIGHINAGLILLSEQIFDITDMDIVFP